MLSNSYKMFFFNPSYNKNNMNFFWSISRGKPRRYDSVIKVKDPTLYKKKIEVWN